MKDTINDFIATHNGVHDRAAIARWTWPIAWSGHVDNEHKAACEAYRARLRADALAALEADPEADAVEVVGGEVVRVVIVHGVDTEHELAGEADADQGDDEEGQPEVTIAFPDRYTVPAGYRPGAHWTEPARGRSGWYLVRDDGEAIRVEARPDLLEVDADDEDHDPEDPAQLTPDEVRERIETAFAEHDRHRLAELDLVLLETMPRYLRAAHVEAGNRGRYPHNGAVRYLVPRARALEVVEADPEWSEILRDGTEADLVHYDVRQEVAP